MNLNNLLAASLLSLSLASGLLSAKTSFFVSAQNGNDSWSGLLASPNANNSDGPLKTLPRAQAAMRASATTKTVNVRAGLYSIASGMQFNMTDNGETWLSYPGETPVLDGATTGTINVPNSTYISQLTFEGFTFQNLGAGGMNINFGSNLTIRWNRFNRCFQSCMNFAALTNSIIDSNTISGQSPGNPSTTVDIAYSAITLYYGSSNNQITHNLIQNCEGGGIAFTAGANNPPNSNNIIDRNILLNVNTKVFDEGAIYMYDRTHSGSGNQITNNIINGNGGSTYLTNGTKAIYLDSGVSGVLVSGNVCRSCGQFAWQIHAGDHNTFVNNVFDMSAPGSMVGIFQSDPSWNASFPMNANVFERNLIYFGGAAPPSLYQVNMTSADSLPLTRNNLYWSATGARIPNSSIYPPNSLIVDSNPIFANPLFAQPSAANYSMPTSSQAYTLIGFQLLATDQGPVSGGPSSTATLTGSGTSSNATVNLTSVGSLDWAHWGSSSMTQKSGVTAQISSWSIVGSNSAAYYYANDARAVSFTDGNSPTNGTVYDGIYVYSMNSGFTFTVPAGTTSRTLTVLVGGYSSAGTLTAHLSDGSAADFVDTTSAMGGQYDRNYTLTFRAASAGQKLTISWIQSSGNGNVTLNGAALQ